MKKYLFFLSLSSFVVFAQKTVSFRIASVYTNMKQMDAFPSSASDPVFYFNLTEGNTSNPTTKDSVSYTNMDCLGTSTINKVFFEKNYSDCTLPTYFQFLYGGYEYDPNTKEALVESKTNIISANLTATDWTTLGTYSLITSGTTCAGTQLMYQFTLQYKLTGNCTVTSVAESTQETFGKLCPNPAQDFVQLVDLKATEYEIIDTKGILVQKGTIDNSIIYVNTLKAGLYYIRLDNKIYKFCKE